MTDKLTESYNLWPGVMRAAVTIAYDNGGINCVRSERMMRSEACVWLRKQPQDILPEIDKWLSGLSDEDLRTACCGEEDAASVILESAPPFTDRLLNDYFDEVC